MYLLYSIALKNLHFLNENAIKTDELILQTLGQFTSSSVKSFKNKSTHFLTVSLKIVSLSAIIAQFKTYSY